MNRKAPVGFGCKWFLRLVQNRGFRFLPGLCHFRFLWIPVLNQLQRNRKIQTRLSLEFRISRVVLKVCRWSPLGGSLHSLATEKFEVRVMPLPRFVLSLLFVCFVFSWGGEPSPQHTVCPNIRSSRAHRQHKTTPQCDGMHVPRARFCAYNGRIQRVAYSLGLFSVSPVTGVEPT